MKMLGDIENAIVDRINAAALGYKLTKVATYGGEFDDALGVVIRNFPAVLTVCKGVTPLKELNTSVEVRATVSVFCCAKSLRNEESARHGNIDAPGTYQIMEDVAKLLFKQQLGLNISPLQFAGQFPLLNEKETGQMASVYVMEFSTKFMFDAADDMANLADFRTFHADIDIPPHGEVKSPLPSEEADARDTVTLPN
ncbi:MAG: DUF1834 family protein [Alphaproteobacteria bacterium]|nr:DUF1834 family protein [Alphaproteobacteria bacterium]